MRDLRNELNIKLARPRGGYIEDLPEEVFTDGGYWQEIKDDGQRVTLQPGIEKNLIVSRNRKNKLKGVAKAGAFRDLSDSVPKYRDCLVPELDGTLFDCEMTGGEGNRGDGTMNESEERLRKEGKFIGFTIFDCLFWKGDDIRGEPLYARRYHIYWAVEYMQRQGLPVRISPAVRGCDRAMMQKVFDQGEEGVVFKHEDSVYDDKKLPWWKAKAHNTVDAFIWGVTEGKSGGSPMRGIKPKPNGRVATFTMCMFRNGGAVVEVGKMFGLPKDLIEDGFKNFNQYKHRVVEMRVSGFDGKRCRWARFYRWRNDKGPADCVFEEQIGQWAKSLKSS